MRRRLLIGIAVVAAAALTLSACGNDSESTPTGAPVTSAAPTTGDTAVSSGTGEVVATDSSESPASTNSSGEPAALDADSVAWMTAFCTGFADLTASGSQLSDIASETDPQVAIPVYTQAYEGLGAGLVSLGGSLSKLAPPTFTDGDKLATAYVSAFAEFGPKMTAKAAELKAVDLTDTTAAAAALKSAGDAGEAFDAGMNEKLGALAELTAAEKSAIVQIPACASMGG